MRTKIFSVVAILIALPASVTAQDTEVSIKATQIVPGITMLEGVGGFVGGNMAVIVGEDGVVLIDDGIEPFSQMILDTVNQYTEEPVDYVLNTHVHGDHVGSNKIFHGAGATVIAHENIRKRLAEGGWQTMDGNRPAEVAEMPVLTFTDAVTFYLNGHTVHVFHVPSAHTDGDSMIHFPDVNVIHASDVVFNGLFPYIDLDSGGSVDGYLAAMRKVLELADDGTQIIPGHGPLANKADVQRAYEMLVDADNRIRAMVEDGKSEEEIVAENPLADYHDDWNWGFITTERMTKTLYRSNTSR